MFVLCSIKYFVGYKPGFVCKDVYSSAMIGCYISLIKILKSLLRPGPFIKKRETKNCQFPKNFFNFFFQLREASDVLNKTVQLIAVNTVCDKS